MQLIILMPALFAAYLALTRSPAAAFVHVYVPVLLLLPDYYRMITPGLPDPTFSEAAIFPVALIYMWRAGWRWRYSLTDGLVAGFAASVAYSEYRASGYADAQNLIFDMLGTVLFPYILAKGLIESGRLGGLLAKRIAFLLFLVTLVSLYEFKFGVTLWRLILDPLFPDQQIGWVTTFRWGFTRVAGPYAHAILAGVLLAVGWRLSRWLEWSGQWERRFRYLPDLPLTKGHLISLGLLCGLFITFTRGPWIGAALAALVAGIGRAKDQRRAAKTVAALLIVVGVPAAIVFLSWIDGGREAAQTVAQESAAYRKEMFEQYLDVAVQHSVWGWGMNGWPQLPGLGSIDNHYLLLLLRHGGIALGFFVLLLGTMSVRLFRLGLAGPPARPRGSSLPFTLLSLYVAIGFAIATVYLGAQTMPVLFVLTGWAEALLLAGPQVQDCGAADAPAPAFRFQRVLT
jgi:hypothetical protein